MQIGSFEIKPNSFKNESNIFRDYLRDLFLQHYENVYFSAHKKAKPFSNLKEYRFHEMPDVRIHFTIINLAGELLICKENHSRNF